MSRDIQRWQYQIGASPVQVDPDDDTELYSVFEYGSIEIPVPIQQYEGFFVLGEPFVRIYNLTNWPFVVSVDTVNIGLNSQIFFEALLDTDDALFPAGAQLINITDGDVPVGGSFLTSSALHTNPVDPTSRVRSGQLVLPSGSKEYRAERGGPTGSGATIHMHEAKLIIVR